MKIDNAFRVYAHLFHFHFPLPTRLTTEGTLVPSTFISPIASTTRTGGLAAVILAAREQC